MKLTSLTTFLLEIFLVVRLSYTSPKSFTIDYEKNTFLKDGQPFRYISGSMHYFRIPQQYWQDRLYKAKKAGLNTIETYVPWNLHEMFKGVYDFEGENDLVQFIQLAKKNDLLVILRPGPYICAEWEYGGFPYWLVKEGGEKIRTSDAHYLKLVDGWFSVLLPKMKPLLYENGGPIITVQVENEYGSFDCQHDYMSDMKDLLRKYLGNNIILFTTDGAANRMVQCGSLASTYTTVDFGPGGNVNASFTVQRNQQKQGPLVNSEFYTGWLDHWGEKHHTTSPVLVSKWLDKILALNASVNMYMFIGGTNFGWMNGANAGGLGLQPVTSSYDYDAPLTEAGDPTEKYWMIQKVISKYQQIPEGPQPVASDKAAYGKFMFHMAVPFFDIVKMMTPVTNKVPLPFESIDLAYGYMLYEADVQGIAVADNLLNIGKFHDRAIVYVDQVYQGTLNRNYGNQLVIHAGRTLSIFVENEGRIGYSKAMLDVGKGLLGNVTLNKKVLLNWKMYGYGVIKDGYNAVDGTFSMMENTKQKNTNLDQIPRAPALYAFSFYIGEAKDTYLKLDNWGKGFVNVNDKMVQKFWTLQGPQRTLFIPKWNLNANSENHLFIFETDHTPSLENALVEFVDSPVFV